MRMILQTKAKRNNVSSVKNIWLYFSPSIYDLAVLHCIYLIALVRLIWYTGKRMTAKFYIFHTLTLSLVTHFMRPISLLQSLQVFT